MTTHTLEPIKIGLEDKRRTDVVSTLSELLANQHVLYLKLRNFHWNLVGARFKSLHELFEQEYTDLAVVIDETAERIRMLGGVAPGSMKLMLEHATLSEADTVLVDGGDAVKHLLADHETTIRDLRTAIREIDEKDDDIGTADFLTSVLKKHEASAWMMRSYLK